MYGTRPFRHVDWPCRGSMDGSPPPHTISTYVQYSTYDTSYSYCTVRYSTISIILLNRYGIVLHRSTSGLPMSVRRKSDISRTILGPKSLVTLTDFFVSLFRRRPVSISTINDRPYRYCSTVPVSDGGWVSITSCCYKQMGNISCEV
jgi:hypothetical protein